jgi:sugar lactone lactonase YvrE
MPFGLLPSWLNASPLQRALSVSILGCVFAAGGTTLSAQIKVISADNLTPFEPRDVGTTSDAKTVRIKLNYARAISSIAIASGFTEFTAGSVSGCVVDGHTINPALSACSVEVTFSPQYPGLRTAPLVVTDNAGIKSSVGLVGTGLGPEAALTPGIITTIAGNGSGGFSGDGGPAREAELSLAQDTAVDAAGNLYISDLGNYRVRKVDINGIITTIAGNGTLGYSGDGGPATSAELGPAGIALDAAGNLYLTSESNSRIRKVDINGIITTVAGNGTRGFSGDGGPATSAELSGPYGVALDSVGNLYFSDIFNYRIRKVDLNGIITTVAGNGTNGFSGDGGPATSARLTLPIGVELDAAGNLYFADRDNQRIRKVDIHGIITTIAGNGREGYSGDGGPATSAELGLPYGIALDAAGNLYIGDQGNQRIRKVDIHGIITTVAGNGIGGFSGDGGPATSAMFVFPLGVTVDAAGNLYIGDQYNNRIRKVDVSKSAVNFASQHVGTTSPSQKVVVTNIGNQHIELTDLTLTGDFGQQAGLASDCTDTTLLGAGFSCALRITFAPTAVGTLTGSATVTDNSLSLPGTKQTISLSGTGAASPTATLSASAVSFGSVAVGSVSPEQTVTITNHGDASLTIRGITLAGTDPMSFAIQNDCGTTLAIGASCAINMIFWPQTTGKLTASVTITDNAGNSPQTISLSGTGVTP